MKAICAALISGALAGIVLLAATPPATLEWPHGGRSQLASPDGRHVVYGERSLAGIRSGPELWLGRAGESERKRLLQLGSTAKAFWFPDSRNLLVVDREGSDRMTTYVYDTEGRVVLDARDALVRKDRELAPLASGHFYVEAQQLLDANTMRVAAFGHTDAAPVQCFRFVYTITRGGAVERVSKRVSPATAKGCDETSE